MTFILENLLTIILFFPILTALLICILPGQQKGLVRWVAFLFSFVPFLFHVGALV